MIPEQLPITGREDKKYLTGPLQALVEFYDAFNNRDLEKMAKNWAQTDEISMDNPAGGIKNADGKKSEKFMNVSSPDMLKSMLNSMLTVSMN